MTTNFYCRNIVLLFLGLGLFVSCHKSDFLDKKPNSDNVIPTTQQDFQALLDNPRVMEGTPVLGELSCDDYQLDLGYWQGLDAKEHNAYAWLPNIYEGQENIEDWNLPYQQVFYANVVLDGLSKLTADSINNDPGWKALKGGALFIRAYAFYNLAQVFAPAYDIGEPGDSLGIPIRLRPEISGKSTRSSVQATYQQILVDLQTAKDLLPRDVPTSHLNRPSRPAALAMLARVYLSMRDYGQAGLYADSCLQVYNELVDLNILNTGAFFPYPTPNPEMMYETSFLSADAQILVGVVYPSVVVDSALYNSYDTNDLRQKIFFRINNSAGAPNYKGSYNGTVFPFSGLATDEVWLIRAECRARAGEIPKALDDLNTLLRKRWVTAAFVPVSTSSAAAALDSILVNRRKELPFRGLRWTDLKRLNKGGANITLTRKLIGVSPLFPNSNLYVLPIPSNVLTLTDMNDNPRP